MQTMKLAYVTTVSRLGLFLAAVLFAGLSGCDDQLLPPKAPAEGQAREPLVYLNEFPNADSIPDYSTVEIKAVRPDGGNPRHITSGMIASSPRNGRMAYYFDGSDDRARGIYVANDDGSDPRLFEAVDAASTFIDPWSVTLGPDGQTIAWYASDMYDMLSLRIKTPARQWESASSVTIGSTNAELSRPRFSPDGKWVGYTRTTLNVADGGEFIMMSTETGETRQISIPLAYPLAPQVSATFDWSPDGRRIVFAGNVGDPIDMQVTELIVLDVFTHDADTLTSDGLYKDSPQWLPGGNQVCYIGMTDEGADMFLCDNAGVTRQLTFDQLTLKFGLTVSPDGRTALYTEFMEYGSGLGTVRSFDLVARQPGPVLESNTALAYWRR